MGCLIAWGFTCKLVRGFPIVPCSKHVRAGGGGECNDRTVRVDVLLGCSVAGI